jgi:hypothetical protein
LPAATTGGSAPTGSIPPAALFFFFFFFFFLFHGYYLRQDLTWIVIEGVAVEYCIGNARVIESAGCRAKETHEWGSCFSAE